MNKNKKKILPSTIVLLVCATVGIVFAGFLLAGKGRGDKNIAKALNKTGQSGGDIWFSSSKKDIKSGENFEIEFYVNTHGNELGVFAFDFNFDEKSLIVDTSQGDDGVEKGADGSNFTLMSNPGDISDGHLRFSGICAQNCVNGDRKKLATIYLKAKKDFDFSNSSNYVDVKELATEMGKTIDFENKNGVFVIK